MDRIALKIQEREESITFLSHLEQLGVEASIKNVGNKVYILYPAVGDITSTISNMSRDEELGQKFSMVMYRDSLGGLVECKFI